MCRLFQIMKKKFFLFKALKSSLKIYQISTNLNKLPWRENFEDHIEFGYEQRSSCKDVWICKIF